jgi:hypothetical protein
MRRGAAAAANPSTSEPLPGLVLLQIEEPAERPDEPDDAGLAIGLELTRTGLRVAASAGGNAELVRGADGALEFLPAVAGYDAAGDLVAGEPGLADASAIGLDALADPAAVDARGRSAADRMAALIDGARRRLMMLTRRPIGRAVVVVPLDASAGLRMALLQAVEAGGVEVLRLIEASVALAIGGGLDRHGDGIYLHLAALPQGIALAWLENKEGVIRLVGGAVAASAAEIPALLAGEAPVAGIIAPGLAALIQAPLLDGFDGPERSVIGAALLAEMLGA